MKLLARLDSGSLSIGSLPFGSSRPESSSPERPSRWRSPLRSGVVGAAVGLVLGFVPLVLLVAPMLAGGVAGVVERSGPRRGVLAGAVAGVLLAVGDALVSWSLVYVRFGSLPFYAGEVSLPSMAFAGLLSLLAAAGGTIVAAIGGGLGGLLVATERGGTAVETGETPPVARVGRRHRAVAALVALGVGVLTFGIVALALTAALDPFIWPSALVGLPLGFVAGATVAVVGYAYLVRGPDSDRDWRRIGRIALAIVVVFSLVIAGLFLLGDGPIHGTNERPYSGGVSISTDLSIKNPTFSAPVPLALGTSAVGGQIVADLDSAELEVGCGNDR